MALPLEGKNILVTRPTAQAADLAQAISSAGGQPIWLPLIRIAPPNDKHALNEVVERLDDFSIVIFISANAVQQGAPSLITAHGRWPSHVLAAGIGPGTARSLSSLGVNDCLTPPIKAGRFDSEALLALPEFAAGAVNGKKIAIMRGEGGRELLSDSLRRRGANVVDAPCYQRIPRHAGWQPLYEAWDNKQLDAITISSSEALRHFVDSLPEKRYLQLKSTPIFAPHLRIIDTARKLGLSLLVKTAPLDTGIVTSLCAYNWPSAER